MQLTQKMLFSRVLYDPHTGSFSSRGKKRKICGINKDGVRTVSVRGTVYLAHLLAWFYMTGEWSKCKHIEGDSNAWLNLQSMRDPLINTSGYVGVSWNKRAGKWVAKMGRTHLGTFDTIGKAIAARKLAEIQPSFI